VSDVAIHPALSFALDVADKAIKLVAVLLGGVWTYWNYRKSRTYAQKMELQIASSMFQRDAIYIEVTAKLKNLGATIHNVQQEGTYCEIVAILSDLTTQTVRLLPVFTRDSFIEPGESISDRLLVMVPPDASSIVWFRIDLEVASGQVEWQESDLIRFENARSSSEKQDQGG
jgi:hypothetical protein